VTTTVTEEKLAPQDWRADAWHLARTDPKNWGHREKVELSGTDQGPIKIVQIEVVEPAVEPAVNNASAETPVTRVEVVQLGRAGA
jgi:hypothetical protein